MPSIYAHLDAGTLKNERIVLCLTLIQHFYIRRTFTLVISIKSTSCPGRETGHTPVSPFFTDEETGSESDDVLSSLNVQGQSPAGIQPLDALVLSPRPKCSWGYVSQ